MNEYIAGKTKLLKTLLLTITILFSACSTKNALVFTGTKGNYEKVYKQKLILLQKHGLEIWDPHENLDKAFKQVYGSTNLDSLSVFNVSTTNANIAKLVEKYPKLGMFIPFNVLIYKTKDEDNTTWIGHMSPELISELSDINSNNKDKQIIHSLFKPLDIKMKSVLKEDSSSKTITYSSIEENSMIFYVHDISGNIEDFKDEFQENFESHLEYNKYIIAGYYDYKEACNDYNIALDYDAYWVYDIVNFKSAYTISQNNPELFTLFPSKVYMYIKNKKLYVGMMRYEKWINLLGLENEKTIEVLKNYDKVIIDILDKLLK